MADDRRIVLLNHVLSESKTRAPQEHRPPIHGMSELYPLLSKNQLDGFAIEFDGDISDDEPDDKKRIERGKHFSFTWLRDCGIIDVDGGSYVVFLFEYVDQTKSGMPVVDTSTLIGRQIAGGPLEKGATSSHFVIKLPEKDEFDDGRYRCAIERSPGLGRGVIERFIYRQLRRLTRGWDFTAVQEKKGRKKEVVYKYHPKLTLVSDVGRRLGDGEDGRKLSYILFTNRGERQSIGQKTSILHEEYYADVEVRVQAKHMPADEETRRTWLSNIRAAWENRGYTFRPYYRGVGGDMVSGDVHHDVSDATDLMMCAKEYIPATSDGTRWVSKIDLETVKHMVGLLERDGLWERVR